jgi:divalent metal cation (Fe/Co/Zn/Cd) transporter
MLVLAGAIVLETFSLLGALREVNLMRGERTLLYWLRHTRNAEIVVVLGEDIAAIIGLVLALGFVTLTYITGDPVYDAIGSIVIGVILIVVAIFIAVRVQALLVGKSAEPDLLASIIRAIEADPHIETLLNTITLQLGPKVMLAAKIKMTSGLSIDEAVEHINQLEVRIKAEHPVVGWCFIEPDVKD